MNGFKGKTALITGGSSGIGLDLARLFLRDGAEVILVASGSERLRSAADALEKESGQRPLAIAKDLSAPSAARELFDECAAKKRSIDILVNNAGFGVYGKFSAGDLSKTLKMIDLNAKAPVALVRYFLPDMVSRGWGRILNVASTAAFQAVPLEAVYAASKAFLLLFSEALSNELAGTGVGVTCLCPGPTRTAFFDDGMFPSKMVKRSMMTSQAVAGIGYGALKKGKPLAIAGLQNRALVAVERVAPRRLVTAIARRVVE